MSGLYSLNRFLSPSLNRLSGAVLRDNVELLKQLLEEEKGYGVDDLSKALRDATDKGRTECVRILLARNAMPDIHDTSGFTPIILAARRGYLDILELLLAVNCNTNKSTYRVRATALHWAATNGHVACARALVKAGSIVDALTMQGRTPLMFAARSDEEELVCELISIGAQVNRGDNSHLTALHLAAEEGALDCVRQLISSGAKINPKSTRGETPLLLAAKSGQDDVVKELLKSPNINTAAISHGLSILHWASHGGYTCCLLQLLPHCQAAVDLQTTETYFGAQIAVTPGITALMMACKGGYSKSTEALLQYDADADIVDFEGMTALLYAINHDHGSCAALLLRHGSDPNKVTLPMDGVEPDPDWPEELQSEEAEEQNAAGDNMDAFQVSPLFLAIRKDSRRCLWELLKANCLFGGFFVSKDGEYLGPMELALCLGRYEICDMFTKLGLPLNLSMTQTIQQALNLLLQREEQHFAEFLHELSSPPLLLYQCRREIRNCMASRVMTQVDKLPLPEALCNFVNLTDLKEFVEK